MPILPGLNEIAPEPVRRYAGDAMQAFRDVKTVMSANPVAYIVNDLAFPDAMSDGTLDSRSRVEKGYLGPSF